MLGSLLSFLGWETALRLLRLSVARCYTRSKEGSSASLIVISFRFSSVILYDEQFSFFRMPFLPISPCLWCRSQKAKEEEERYGKPLINAPFIPPCFSSNYTTICSISMISSPSAWNIQSSLSSVANILFVTVLFWSADKQEECFFLLFLRNFYSKRCFAYSCVGQLLKGIGWLTRRLLQAMLRKAPQPTTIRLALAPPTPPPPPSMGLCRITKLTRTKSRRRLRSHRTRKRNLFCRLSSLNWPFKLAMPVLFVFFYLLLASSRLTPLLFAPRFHYSHTHRHHSDRDFLLSRVLPERKALEPRVL